MVLAWCGAGIVAFVAGKRLHGLIRSGEEFSTDGRVTLFVLLLAVLAMVILCFALLKRLD